MMDQWRTWGHTVNGVCGVELPVQGRPGFDENYMAIVPANMMQRHDISLLTECHRNTLWFLMVTKEGLTYGKRRIRLDRTA